MRVFPQSSLKQFDVIRIKALCGKQQSQVSQGEQGTDTYRVNQRKSYNKNLKNHEGNTPRKKRLCENKLLIT